MVKPNPNCKVCKTIEKKPSLKNEIYNCTWFVRTSRVKPSELQRRYQDSFTYESLQRHLHNGHQALTETQIRNKNTKSISKTRQKQIQGRADNVNANEVWNQVIQEGMNRLNAGELEMKVSDLLKATKDKSDFEFKVKDQELAMAEMVAYFASGEGDTRERKKYDARIIEGESSESFDASTEFTEDSSRRSEQSSSFYQRITRDAITSGTD